MVLWRWRLCCSDRAQLPATGLPAAVSACGGWLPTPMLQSLLLLWFRLLHGLTGAVMCHCCDRALPGVRSAGPGCCPCCCCCCSGMQLHGSLTPPTNLSGCTHCKERNPGTLLACCA
jgi:hypothetical protein